MFESPYTHAAVVALIGGLLVGKAFYLGYLEGRQSVAREQQQEADR